MRDTTLSLYENQVGLFLRVAAERIETSLKPAELSRHIDRLGSIAGGIPVVLDASGVVVAHRLIGRGLSEPARPAQIDPLLAQLMSETPRYISKSNFQVRLTEAAGKQYGLAMQTLDAPKGWQVGIYRERPILARLISLKRLLYGESLAVLGIAVITAFFASRTITRPLRDIASTAEDVGRFELETEPLPSSRITELNQTASAINSMVASLRWFALYVPRNVVRRLMLGRDVATAEERELTILFTDIAGFTTTSETMTPTQLNDFINHHLSIVTDCIQEQGGVVDKYIGDAVMAFFGAPASMPDHALRGCRAALAVRRAIEADNVERRRQDLKAVHVRVGIHMGSVVIGNIGSKSRVNYSIIGDPVNVAARLESQGKELGNPNQEVGILASSAVLDAAGLTSEAQEVGFVKLQGRLEELLVFRL
ncbi:MAG: adenylate/guanylate cyclase domain-containing protein [Hyphomicrobiales bacterium]|nr:adenylate/guanylate cyclase domain-containing protein [Hyphomicrobiales bacterium]